MYDRFKARCVDKPITLFYDYIPQSIEDLQHNPYNFLLLHEPNEFFGMHTWAKNNHGYFTINIDKVQIFSIYDQMRSFDKE